MSGIDELKGNLNQLAEAFSEVEDDLDPTVYKAIAPNLDSAVKALSNVAAQLQNAQLIQRLNVLLTTAPQLTLDEGVIASWERLVNTGMTIHPDTIHAIPPAPPTVAMAEIPPAAPRRRPVRTEDVVAAARINPIRWEELARAGGVRADEVIVDELEEVGVRIPEGTEATPETIRDGVNRMRQAAIRARQANPAPFLGFPAFPGAPR